MELIFGHDHKFRLIDGKYYSTGGLSEDILMRYVNIFGTITVVARVIKEFDIKDRYSLINNPRIKIINRKEISHSELETLVKDKKVIVRLPSIIGSEIAHICKKNKYNYFAEVVACAFNSYWYHSFRGKLVALPADIITKGHVKSANYVLYVTDKFLQSRYPTNGIAINCSDVILSCPEDKMIQERRVRVGQNNKKYILGTISAIDVKYKGQEYVIRALSELKKKGIINFEYQLVGNGNSDRLLNIAKKYNVLDQIKIMGGLPHEKIFDWLKSIDIYIQPSVIEGLPRALIEAMSCGVPCLGSNTGGIPELLNKDALFRKKDIHQISRILENISDEWLIRKSNESFIRALDFDEHVLNEKRNGIYIKYCETSYEKSSIN